MENLQVFNDEKFGNLRTIEINGEPWFCAKDVLVALEYSNTFIRNITKALSHVPAEWKGQYPILTLVESKIYGVFPNKVCTFSLEDLINRRLSRIRNMLPMK